MTKSSVLFIRTDPQMPEDGSLLEYPGSNELHRFMFWKPKCPTLGEKRHQTRNTSPYSRTQSQLQYETHAKRGNTTHLIIHTGPRGPRYSNFVCEVCIYIYIYVVELAPASTTPKLQKNTVTACYCAGFRRSDLNRGTCGPGSLAW